MPPVIYPTFMKPGRSLTILLLFALSLCASCVSSHKTAIAVSPDRIFTTASGLSYRIVAAGRGPAAQPGQFVRIHEITTLADGTLIYSTRTKNSPLKFLLGGNQVIAGVDEGVTGM